MNALITKPALARRVIERVEPDGDRVDTVAQFDALIDVLLSVLIFRNPADERVSILHRPTFSPRSESGGSAEGLRVSYLFETACYLLAALDSWHTEHGLERLRDEVFRAIVVPRFFSLFDLPGRTTNLEAIVVSRMEVYNTLTATSPDDVRCYFMQAFLASTIEGSPTVESLTPDYAFIGDNLVLAMAALSDLTSFAATRLPLCFGAIESFYRRLYSSTNL